MLACFPFAALRRGAFGASFAAAGFFAARLCAGFSSGKVTAGPCFAASTKNTEKRRMPSMKRSDFAARAASSRWPAMSLKNFSHLPVVTAETAYYLKSYAVLCLLGILWATPLVRNAAAKLEQHRSVLLLEPLVLMALLLVCTAYLVDGSFSPFLYFRF